jgi:cyanate permease
MFFGYLADTTHSFHTGLILAALAPLVAIVVILLLWPSDRRSPPPLVPTES